MLWITRGPSPYVTYELSYRAVVLKLGFLGALTRCRLGLKCEECNSDQGRNRKPMTELVIVLRGWGSTFLDVGRYNT